MHVRRMQRLVLKTCSRILIIYCFKLLHAKTTLHEAVSNWLVASRCGILQT
jgi:hypothetical protein